MKKNNIRHIYQRRETNGSKKARRNDLEQSIMDGCGVYRRENLACIDKVPEPSQIVKYIGNRKYIVRFGNEPNNLFMGLMKNGRMIAFCYAQSEYNRFKDDCVREKIVKRLSDLQDNGAVCFILIGTPHNECYRIPLKTWLTTKTKYKGNGIPKEDAFSHKVFKGKDKALLFLSDIVTD